MWISSINPCSSPVRKACLIVAVKSVSFKYTCLFFFSLNEEMCSTLQRCCYESELRCILRVL